VLVVLAVREARRTGDAPTDIGPARKAGWGVVAMAVAGLAVQSVWLALHLERVKPMLQGDPAPMFALPRIGPNGALGEPFSLASAAGKVVVVDFWATWCGPCLRALPHLDRLQQRHPGITVVTINIDEPAEARALFDERGYKILLLAGDQATSDQYGVSAIPHTVLIDRSGVVRTVLRGGGADLESAIAPYLR
jgi:thiol-disulfide isomerase/thioredoxin